MLNKVNYIPNETVITAQNLNDIQDEIINRYPIGSIYLSVNSTSPASLFGGIWEQITDRFLLTAGNTYTNGTTGGSENTVLSIANIPTHTHIFTGDIITTASTGDHKHGPGTLYGYYKCRETDNNGSGFNGAERITSTKTDANSSENSVVINGGTTASAGAHTHTFTPTGTNSSIGSGTAFSNMPPYLVIYAWKRVE